MIIIVLAWFLLSFVVASYGKPKGHSYLIILVGSLIVSPIIMGLLVLLMKGDSAKMLENSGQKKCGSCGELIKVEAIICRYCHTKIKPEL